MLLQDLTQDVGKMGLNDLMHQIAQPFGELQHLILDAARMDLLADFAHEKEVQSSMLAIDFEQKHAHDFAWAAKSGKFDGPIG